MKARTAERRQAAVQRRHNRLVMTPRHGTEAAHSIKRDSSRPPLPRISAHSRCADSSGIVQQAAARSSAPEPQQKSFASAPSSRPIDARHPGESRRQRRAICSAAGFGSQPPAGSAAAWPSGELWQSYLRFEKRLSSFSSYLRFLYIGISRVYIEFPKSHLLRNRQSRSPTSETSSHLFSKSWLALTMAGAVL